ncbi:ANAPC2 [Symbiodinium sp. CCMP2592]|nr:ANAPC2 [Symbiodinium sp. CCMP2592]
MFIKEYKEMLADRLLANPTYHAEREMQNLELLKTRFGDAALVHCEVMLQDIKDSKRINGSLAEVFYEVQSAVTTLHHTFAPKIVTPQGRSPTLPAAWAKGSYEARDLERNMLQLKLALGMTTLRGATQFVQSPRLPAQLEEALSEYGHAYTKTKAKRRLSWAERHVFHRFLAGSHSLSKAKQETETIGHY